MDVSTGYVVIRSRFQSLGSPSSSANQRLCVIDHQRWRKDGPCLESNGWLWCCLVDRIGASVGDGPGLSHLKSEREEQDLVPLDEIRALLC